MASICAYQVPMAQMPEREIFNSEVWGSNAAHQNFSRVLTHLGKMHFLSLIEIHLLKVM